MRRDAAGLVCAPRSAPELAGPAIGACPLPLRALAEVPGWPDPPAAMLAGWYRRSPAHAPAPAGVRELVQAPGEGFGPGDHPTTAMCLELIDAVPGGRALDVGTGSGLLAQAWASLGRGPVAGIDLDPRALEQAARSLAAAGLAGRVELRRAPAGGLDADEIAGATLLANVPLPAHRALLAAAAAPPVAAVLSGLRPGEAGEVAAGWRAAGMRLDARIARGGFCALLLRAGG